MHVFCSDKTLSAMTISILCSCNQLLDHMACTLVAHFAHMRVLTCTCATSSLQAAALICWPLLVCVTQDNNFACFYKFSLFGQPLNNVSTSRSFSPAVDCWAIRRPLPADYGRPWCIRLGHICSIASTALSRVAATAHHAGFTVKTHVKIRSFQLHAQLLSETAATVDHTAQFARVRLDSCLSTGRVQC